MARALGIDGCRSGWVGVFTEGAEFRTACTAHAKALPELLDRVGSDVAVVDIPIGLSNGSVGRLCDEEARREIPGRSSSVFPTPSRYALEAKGYEAAVKAQRAATGSGLSQQSFALFPKIREVDAVVLKLGQKRLREGHPEVSFALANIGVPLARKRSPKGVFQRIRLLEHFGFALDRLAEEAEAVRCDVDDLLDAAILCWSAARVLTGKQKVLGHETQTDAHGLLMQMHA